MSKYFPKLKFLETNVKFELDLSNYATKTDLKNTAGVDTSDFVKKTGLATFKSDVDKLKNVPSNLSNELEILKLETTSVDLSKLSNV